MSLTKREREVTRCLTRALTNKEIASELGLSKETVKQYVNVIRGKMYARNRVELAIMAIRDPSIMEDPLE